MRVLLLILPRASAIHTECNFSNRACSVGDFFNGWRRKTGLVTLAMACAVMGLWMRSHVLIDGYEISVQDREHAFGSFHGYLNWRSWDREWGTGDTWVTFPAHTVSSESLLDLKSESVVGSRPRQWVIPHAWIAPSLTLHSAYLILIKPRKAKGSPQISTHVWGRTANRTATSETFSR